MPEFNVADVVPHLLRRLNFVGLFYPTGTQKPGQSAHASGVKASRIQVPDTDRL
jgi:hypothetical protein